MRDFLKFLETAYSSLNEVEYLLEFLCAKSLITQADYNGTEKIRAEASRVLSGLIKSLRLKLKISNDWQRNLGEEHFEYLTGDTDSVDE